MLRWILRVFAIAICLTALGTAYKRLEIDASAFGFPYSWLIRFPPEMTQLHRAFYFYRWENLFLNFGIYFVMVLTLSLILRVSSRKSIMHTQSGNDD